MYRGSGEKHVYISKVHRDMQLYLFVVRYTKTFSYYYYYKLKYMYISIAFAVESNTTERSPSLVSYLCLPASFT